MIEAGDKLVSKYSFQGLFIVGNEYIVEFVEYSLYHDDYKIFIRCGSKSYAYWFLLNSEKNYYYLYKYFKNICEIRSEKLNKINQYESR